MSGSSLPLLSQSSLQDYVDCPRRFQLRHLDRLEYPSVESEPFLENERHIREGRLFHELVHQHWLGVPAEKLAAQAGSADTARWLRNFSDHDFAISSYVKLPEFTLGAALGRYRLIAKFDLVAVQAGKRVLIFDWKTYRKVPPRDWLLSRMQTRVYRALMVMAGAPIAGGRPPEPEQIELVYWFPGFPGESVHLPYDSTQYQQDQELLLGLVTEIHTAREFPLTEDLAKCSLCLYRSPCNRGRAAGTASALDEDLGGDRAFDLDFDQVGEISF